MSELKNEHETDTSTLRRRDLLRGAAALVAGGVALDGNVACEQRKRSEEALAVDAGILSRFSDRKGADVGRRHPQRDRRQWAAHSALARRAAEPRVVGRGGARASARSHRRRSPISAATATAARSQASEGSQRSTRNARWRSIRSRSCATSASSASACSATTAARASRTAWRSINPQVVERAAVLDIVPTHYLFSRVDKAFAESAYHWFFFARPTPFPEIVISNSLDLFVGRGDPTLGAEGVRTYFEFPGTLHAMCEDYRAAGSIDFAHDEAEPRGTKVACPLLVLWGQSGSVAGRYDALAIWGERAARVTGKQMPGGRPFQESHPAETVAELRAFLSA